MVIQAIPIHDFKEPGVAMGRHHRSRINPQIVLLAVILVIITALMAIPAYVISHRQHAFTIEELRLRAEGIAVSVATMLQQNLKAYRAISAAGAIDDLREVEYQQYLELNALLRHIGSEAGTDFLFTERWVDQETAAYILDGTDPQSNDFSPFGSLDGIDPVERKAFLEHKTLSTGLVEDPLWGPFITGYSPIIDVETGDVLGLVGVDFSAESVKNLTKRFDLLLAGSFFLLIVLTSIGIYISFVLLARAAMEDYLTKLHTRRYFVRRLREEISLARRGRELCVLIADIDWFKHVNDTLGHAEGDRLLVAIASAIRTQVRRIDTCVRYGGDEFAVVFPDCTVKECHAIAKRIQQAVTTVDATPDKKASLSIGIARWQSPMDEHELIACADQALYQTKAEGKGKIAVYGAKAE